MIIVNNNYDAARERWSFDIEEIDDVVPAFFLGMKVGLGW